MRGPTGIALVVITALHGGKARGQTPPGDAFAVAETKYASGDLAAACPLYEEALAGEDALPWKSAFLATTKLAKCKRDAGKLASAARLYRHAADIIHTQSKSTENAQRAATAQKVADELALVLSHLTITIDPEAAKLDGLAITIDGGAIAADQWNQAMEVDGGSYAIHASAPGRLAFDQTVTIADEQDRQQVTVPVLAPEPAVVEPPDPEIERPVAPTVERPVAPPVEQPILRPVETRGRSHVPAIAAASVGVVGLGVAAALELSARSTYGDYEDDSTHPMDLLDSANGKRDLANIAVIAGSLGLAAGAVLWFVWPARVESKAGTTAVVPVLDAAGGGVAVVGWF